MDFQLTDEQRLIAESARGFADLEILPRVEENDRSDRFDRELASKLGEVGYLGATVAEEYGDTGSDAANLRTRATRTGSGWSISGQKMWISLANHSEVALVFAQTDPAKKHRGLACFLPPTESEGVATSQIRKLIIGCAATAINAMLPFEES